MESTNTQKHTEKNKKGVTKTIYSVDYQTQEQTKADD